MFDVSWEHRHQLKNETKYSPTYIWYIYFLRTYIGMAHVCQRQAMTFAMVANLVHVDVSYVEKQR